MLRNLICLTTIVFLCTSCICNIKNHGTDIEDSDKISQEIQKLNKAKNNKESSYDQEQVSDLVKSGYNREQINQLLGSPSTKTHFDGETWYYISTKTKSCGFLTPDIYEEKILAINFDKDGKIKKVSSYDEKELNKTEYISQETPILGTSSSKIHHFIKNIGKYNIGKQKRKRP
jgi:outer membrane protein assembly factor BamE (lipoprotein component of BamABCDE complex)